MPAVLATGPTVMQNSLFLPAAVTTTSTQFAYPQKDVQVELAWMDWLNVNIVCIRDWSPISVLTHSLSFNRQHYEIDDWRKTGKIIRTAISLTYAQL